MDHSAFSYLAFAADSRDILHIVGLWERSPLLHHVERHLTMVAEMAKKLPDREDWFWELFHGKELDDIIQRNAVTELFPTSRFSVETVTIARELTRCGLKDCDPGGWAMDFEDADFSDLLARLEEPIDADEE